MYDARMFDAGGPESWSPGEDLTGASESAGEQGKQKASSGSSAGFKQIQKEERKARKRDSGIAHAILQFLSDKQRTHLATLISRLVGTDCPSPFILAVLSLINEECRSVVEEYLKETLKGLEEEIFDAHRAIVKAGQIEHDVNRQIVEWITRMELTLSVETDRILDSLLIDEKHIDGTVLQLTTFVLQDFLQSQGKAVPFESLQPLSVSILQSLFEPFLRARIERRALEETKKEDEDDE